MKKQIFHDMTDAELNEKLAGLKAELYTLRFNHATGQLENTAEITNCKRDIARVLTVLRARELKNDVAKKA